MGRSFASGGSPSGSKYQAGHYVWYRSVLLPKIASRKRRHRPTTKNRLVLTMSS
jgi:membrane-bound inhibitor of C-type lysozyme